jgi:hypothetical protein
MNALCKLQHVSHRRFHNYIYTKNWPEKYRCVQELYSNIKYTKYTVTDSMVYTSLRISTNLGFIEQLYTHFIRLGFPISIEVVMAFPSSVTKHTTEYNVQSNLSEIIYITNE